MKYLVTARRRESVQTVVSALQAAKEYVNNELKSGRLNRTTRHSYTQQQVVRSQPVW